MEIQREKFRYRHRNRNQKKKWTCRRKTVIEDKFEREFKRYNMERVKEREEKRQIERQKLRLSKKEMENTEEGERKEIEE